MTQAPIIITNSLTIELPYPGAVISKNLMFIAGDRRKGYVKEAKQWQQTLVGWLQQWPFYHLHKHILLPVEVEIGGRFVDEQHRPDMHNLSELVCDGIQEGIDINDKEFEVSTKKPEMGVRQPVVIVTVRIRMEF